MIFLAGCAGREANPIPVYLPGDNERSCNVLVAEIAQLQADMQRLLPKTDKGVSNALWATAGVFLIVPFFFMDLKGAEKIEFDAMRARHNRLLLICADKGCDLATVKAERIPSAEEMKKMINKDKLAKSTLLNENNQYNDTPTGYSFNDLGTLKTCANCDASIGRLEKAKLFKNNIVCTACYSKLTGKPGTQPVSKRKTAKLIKQCATCRSYIGRFEKFYTVADKITCPDCYSKMMKRPKMRSVAKKSQRIQNSTVESELDSLLDSLNKTITK